MNIFKNEILRNEAIKIGLLTWVDQCEDDHIHEFLEFVYLVEGEMTHYINGKKYHCRKGSFLYINRGETHSFVSKGKASYINLLVLPEAFKDSSEKGCTSIKDIFELYNLSEFHFQWDVLPSYQQFEGVKLVEVENIFHYMLNEFNTRNIGYGIVLRNCLFNILIELARKICGESESEKAYYGSVKFYEVKQYVDQNYLERISLNELAQKFFCSTAYLSRLFKKYTGKPFVQYVQCKRIEKAIEYLLTTTRSVEEIAFAVGYIDKHQFFTLFKKYTNKTPKKFRDDNKNTTKMYRSMYYQGGDISSS